jgi:predicted nucleic acid-binding protein
LGGFELLRDRFGRVVVPQEVWNEVVGEGIERPGSAAVASASWIDIMTPADPLAIERLRHILDAGEAAAISLCRELGADLLLCDDLETRRVAAGEGIRVVGTLGRLLRSKQMGLLDFGARQKVTTYAWSE